MKKIKKTKSFISLFLSVCVAITSMCFSTAIYAANDRITIDGAGTNNDAYYDQIAEELLAQYRNRATPLAYGEAKVLTMPVHYRQNGQSWSNDLMKTRNLSIGQYGCCLTSFAMIVNYFGFSQDPGEVNSTVGNYACDFIYKSAGELYGLSINLERRNDNGFADSTALEYIRACIYVNSRPVLVGLKKGSSTHFVVAYGYVDMTMGGTPEYKILDPSTVYNKTNLSDYLSDGWSVHRIYEYKK